MQEGEGIITIELDKAARKIAIEDNGMGIPTRYFERTMSKIGNSDKTLKNDRGFRGIGRLCGLAYCEEAQFTSTAKGETKLSVMTINAKQLRGEFFGSRNYSAESILRKVITFDKRDADVDEHFFRVELIDIVETNNALFNKDKVRDYLSFVAPVTYSPQFYFQQQIYNRAAELNFKIAEYRVEVNGEPCVKNYKTDFNTFRNGADEIFDLYFRNFKDKEGNLIAWSWIGLSTFKGVISETRSTPDYKMRGIRLRAGNTQIGDQDVFKNLFKENRDTKYFIGEVHVVDKNLIPNARHDYFEENETCKALEKSLKGYFEELHDIYHDAADLRELFASKDSSKIDGRQRKAEKNSDTPKSRVVLHIIKNKPSFQPAPKLPRAKQRQFPPLTCSKDLQKLFNAIENIILENPHMSGQELINKIKNELAKQTAAI